MSYQPQPPMMSTPPPPPPPPAPPSVAVGGRRRGLLVAGIGVLVLGLVAAVVLFVMGSSTLDEAVKDLARAPVGCTTTLQFERSGTFILYVETKGSTGDVAGDCPAGGTSYQRSSVDLPDVTLTLRDADDAEVDLAARTTSSYEAAGYSGQSVQSVEIEAPGAYRLTVESDDDDFAIAIGNDPNEDADALKGLALIVGALGLLAGIVLTVLGAQRRPGALPPQAELASMPIYQPAPAAPTWQPQPLPPSDPFGRPPSAPGGHGEQPPGPIGEWGAPPR